MPNSRVLWIGVGCQRGTSRESIETAIQQVCHSYDLAESAIAGIATIDTKANETGIIELCQHRNWALKVFPANILNSVKVPNPSNIVGQKVGTFSVAEAAALCAIEQTSYTILKNRQDACSTNSESAGVVGILPACGVGILPIKNRQDACSTNSESAGVVGILPACGVSILPYCGVGILPAPQRLLVPKQIFRTKNPHSLQEGIKAGYALTVAVAVCAIEY